MLLKVREVSSRDCLNLLYPRILQVAFALSEQIWSFDPLTPRHPLKNELFKEEEFVDVMPIYSTFRPSVQSIRVRQRS